MSRLNLLIINGAALTVCAVFDFTQIDFSWLNPEWINNIEKILFIDRTTALNSVELNETMHINLLIGLMLFLPLLDKTFTYPALKPNKTKLISWALIITTAVTIIDFNPGYANAALSTLIFAALPEEWFFRAYFMQQLNKELIRNKLKIRSLDSHSRLTANIITSTLFALLHTPTQGWIGLSTFFPSLVFGWLFQRSNDLIIVTLLHALSNIIFIVYLNKIINNY